MDCNKNSNGIAKVLLMRRIIQILCMFLVITSGLSFASASEKFTPAGSKQRPEIFVQLGQGPVSTVAFSPDGKYVVTGSDDLTVKLWDVASGREIRTFRGHAAKITAVGVSSDGGMVVSGDEKGVIKLWYTVTGQEIKSIQGHAKQIGFLSFASDNRLFTSVAMDWTMKTWNAATGQLVKTTINIRGLPFMASGNTFVAASNDLASNSLSLLDISNASEIGTFKADKGIFLHPPRFRGTANMPCS